MNATQWLGVACLALITLPATILYTSLTVSSVIRPESMHCTTSEVTMPKGNGITQQHRQDLVTASCLAATLARYVTRENWRMAEACAMDLTAHLKATVPCEPRTDARRIEHTHEH